MGRDVFHFQQFTIRQDHRAMKVGTDAVLVSAWAARAIGEWYDTAQPAAIHEIGTGNGVMALILAQLFENAQITACEINEAAAQQARENITASRYANRIAVHPQSLQAFTEATSARFDYIVTNPPYFVRSYLPADKARSKARHSQELPFGVLLNCVDRLLAAEGLFCLILPFNVSQSFAIEAAAKGLHLVRLTGVRDTVDHPTIRHLLMFARQQLPFKKTGLTLYKKGREERSAAFHELTKDLYLQS